MKRKFLATQYFTDIKNYLKMVKELNEDMQYMENKIFMWNLSFCKTVIIMYSILFVTRKTCQKPLQDSNRNEDSIIVLTMASRYSTSNSVALWCQQQCQKDDSSANSDSVIAPVETPVLLLLLCIWITVSPFWYCNVIIAMALTTASTMA